jgi:hypothetical protein
MIKMMVGFALVVGIFGMSACKKEDKTTSGIVGVWKLTKLRSVNYMDNVLESDETLEGQSLLNELGLVTWEFTTGGKCISSYQSKIGDPVETEEGTYVLNGNKLTITFIEDGVPDSEELLNVKITNSQLTGETSGEYEEDGVKVSYTTYFTFNKQ